MIRSIDKSLLTKRFGESRLRHLEGFAIDEVYVGKKPRDFTIVIEWKTGAIVYVDDGRGEDVLKRLWWRLRGSRAKIKAVATDMSSACNTAVVKNLPSAKQFFDRFHIPKLMNDRVTQLRRDVRAEVATVDRKVLKGLRRLLLKHRKILMNQRTNEFDCRKHWTRIARLQWLIF